LVRREHGWFPGQERTEPGGRVPGADDCTDAGTGQTAGGLPGTSDEH